MIVLTGVSKGFGTQLLFEGVDLRLDPGKRYGIVGANGSGKSTLLRIITGEESSDGGEVSIPTRVRTGTLTQDHYAFEDVPIMDVVMAGKPELAEAFREKELLLRMPEPPADRVLHVEEVIADRDGYAAESRIGEMLEGLGIPAATHREPMRVLSGGYKLRVLLARCLFGDPDALLLDEPTNHLDIYSIRWLEEYLSAQRGVVAVVSHDRELLDRLCTHILDIDYGTVKQYTGNYTAFLEAKKADERMRTIEAERAEKKIGELQAFVDRFKAKATKARQAQSKTRAIERMAKAIEAPVYSSRVQPRIAFSIVRDPGKQVLAVEALDKSFGDKRVLAGVTFSVGRGDRLAIIGPNGIGKSTLLKIVMGELAHDAGEVRWGHETHPQYFSQDHRELIPPTTTPYDWLYQWAPGETIGTIRGILGRMLFSRDDVHKSTGALSGGEAARLVLSKLMLLKGNVLVLDEPTNHLDMEAIEALVEALDAFAGTVLLVSHNRYVVEHVASKVLEITPEGVTLFAGDYRSYLDRRGTDHLAYQVDLRGEGDKKARRAGRGDDPREEDKKARRQAQARRGAFLAEARPALATAASSEAEIEEVEKALAEIDALFVDPGYFAETAPDDVKATHARRQELQARLEAVYEAWERANAELESLRSKHGVEED